MLGRSTLPGVRTSSFLLMILWHTSGSTLDLPDPGSARMTLIFSPEVVDNILKAAMYLSIGNFPGWQSTAFTPERDWSRAQVGKSEWVIILSTRCRGKPSTEQYCPWSWAYMVTDTRQVHGGYKFSVYRSNICSYSKMATQHTTCAWKYANRYTRVHAHNCFVCHLRLSTNSIQPIDASSTP